MYIVIGHDNRQYGPADLPTLAQWVQAGSIRPETWLIDQATGQGLQAGQLPALRPLFLPMQAPSAAYAQPIAAVQPDAERPGKRLRLLIGCGLAPLSLVLVSMWFVSMVKEWMAQMPLPSRERHITHVTRADALREEPPLAKPPGRVDPMPVYFVPLGNTQPKLVEDLARYYRQHLGLKITTLRRLPIPGGLYDAQRGQYPISNLKNLMERAYPQHVRACMIGITDCDLCIAGDSTNFYFSQRWEERNGTRGAILSIARLDPTFFGEPADPELLWSRARKLTTRAVGALYFGLTQSDDPDSPQFGTLASVPDLDSRRQSF